jgi:hypothetical protein
MGFSFLAYVSFKMFPLIFLLLSEVFMCWPFLLICNMSVVSGGICNGSVCMFIIGAYFEV